jgi:hypothetical protein
MTADKRWIGQQVQCPTCKNSFSVPTGTRVQPTAPPPIGASAPTSVSPERMSGLALVSFCLALVTLPLNALGRVIHFPIGLLGCIPAVIYGHLALNEIRKRAYLKGRAFAITGLIIGYLALVLGVISLAFLLVRSTGNHTSRAPSMGMQTPAPDVAVTTDPNKVQIPEAAISGTVENLPFSVAEADVSSGVLHLRDQPNKPNIEVSIFLFPGSNEPLSGLKRVAPGKSPAPHVHLRWKDGPAIRTRATTHNYAMRLEFGEQKGNVIPGKLYLEMPPSYGTKLAGTFEAQVK